MIVNPKSSADFFFKKELNTVGTTDGKKDHLTFEKKLGDLWDSKFNYHYNHILANRFFIERIQQETIDFFFEYAIVSRFRRSKMEGEFNDNFLSFKSVLPEFLEAIKGKLDELKGFTQTDKENAFRVYELFSEEVDKLDKRQKNVKYPALIPEDAKVLVPSTSRFELYITHDDSFILSDSGAIIEKSSITFDWHGTALNKIDFVIIPLNPRLALKIVNAEETNHQDSMAFWASEKTVELFNINSILCAFNQVLGSSAALLLDSNGKVESIK